VLLPREAPVRRPGDIHIGSRYGDRERLIDPVRAELPGPHFVAAVVVPAQERVVAVVVRLTLEREVGEAGHVRSASSVGRGREGKVVALCAELPRPLDRARGVYRTAVRLRDQTVRDELIEAVLLPGVPEVCVQGVPGAARELERQRPVRTDRVHHAVVHAFAQPGDDVPEPRRALARHGVGHVLGAQAGAVPAAGELDSGDDPVDEPVARPRCAVVGGVFRWRAHVLGLPAAPRDVRVLGRRLGLLVAPHHLQPRGDRLDPPEGRTQVVDAHHAGFHLRAVHECGWRPVPSGVARDATGGLAGEHRLERRRGVDARIAEKIVEVGRAGLARKHDRVVRQRMRVPAPQHELTDLGRLRRGSGQTEQHRQQHYQRNEERNRALHPERPNLPAPGRAGKDLTQAGRWLGTATDPGRARGRSSRGRGTAPGA